MLTKRESSSAAALEQKTKRTFVIQVTCICNPEILRGESACVWKTGAL